MPSLSINVDPSACEPGGGVISGTFSSSIVEDVTIYLEDTNGTPQIRTFTAVSSGSFEFTSLGNDGYIITGVGSTSSLSSPISRTINCTSSGGGTTGCDVSISSVTITAGDGETATTATINASGTGTLEYSLDGGAFQSSNVFVIEPGVYIVLVRNTTDTTCSAIASFLISEPDSLSVVSPVRDWLPVGQDIIYTFTSPNAEPQPLALRIEVSSNGVNFATPILAGVLTLPPDSNKQYVANVAPYLEAMFTPGNPVLSGQDLALYKRYRIVAGELPGFNGETGTPELTTPEAFCLYATELTPIINRVITLTQSPNGINNSAFSGIETKVNVATSELTTRSVVLTGTTPEPCLKYPIQLYWLNRAGGWQTWVFDGKHEYEEETEEGVFWKDANGRTHLASVPGITEKVQVFSGFVPLSSYNTVFGVLSSIRKYHRDNNVWREVNTESGSYLKHKQGLRRKELNFSFTYAQSLTVQNA